MSEKKLTPMQEHIAWLEEQFLECIEAGYSESYINAYNSSLRHARKMLEKEREAIVRSFMNVSDDRDRRLEDVHLREFAEEYFNETFASANPFKTEE